MKNNNFKNVDCWVVSEGMAGTENQCIAVAEALGVSFDVKRIALRQPWTLLSPYLGFEQSYSFSPALTSPWPDLVIASGRKSIAASRYIKKESGGRTFTVQIQDPRVSPHAFDLVAVPHHDPTRGDNVIVTDAAPNRVTKERLLNEHHEFSNLETMRTPRIAVLLGGDSQHHRFTEAVAHELAGQLVHLTQQGSLMITASRRTPPDKAEILRAAICDTDSYIWDGEGPNPYFAMLALADYILVTADSASMISDACSTGKPVYMINLEGSHPRIDKLHKHLIDKGVLRVFGGNLEAYTYESLNDAEKIADAVRERMKL